MQSAGHERREFQRLELDPPIDAHFGDSPVSLLEIGVLGARVGHAQPLEPRGELRFMFDGNEITLRCDVVRTLTADQAKYSGSQMESGTRFLAAVGESGDRLRSMLARLVTNALEARYEDSGATRLRLREVDGDRTVRGLDAQFICYRFEHGSWRKRHVFLPEQPPLGFTVGRGESTDELQRLCAVYEASDEEGRRLIRLFAELSVSTLLRIPPSSPPRPEA